MNKAQALQYIENTMSLRDPQEKSLCLFADYLETERQTVQARREVAFGVIDIIFDEGFKDFNGKALIKLVKENQGRLGVDDVFMGQVEKAVGKMQVLAEVMEQNKGDRDEMKKGVEQAFSLDLSMPEDNPDKMANLKLQAMHDTLSANE